MNSETPGCTMNFRHVNCPLCEGSQQTQHLTGYDLQYGIPGEFFLVRCVNCRHVFMNPQPDADSIGACYPDNYGPHRGASIAANDTAAATSSHLHDSVAAESSEVTGDDRAAPWYLSGFVRRIPGLRGLYYWLTDSHAEVLPPLSDDACVLEIGCAHGQFLHKLTAQGWTVTGVEPADNAAAAARAQGFDARTGTLSAASFSTNQFDAAFAWMVIEHLPDPRETLDELSRVLKPGGWLALSVPNFGCWEPKVFGKYWDAYELPRHLQHFTARTITRVLNDCGFEVEKLQCQHNLLNVVGSLGFALRARWPNSRLAHRLIEFPHQPGLAGQLLLALPAKLLALMGQGGRFTILARTRAGAPSAEGTSA